MNRMGTRTWRNTIRLMTAVASLFLFATPPASANHCTLTSTLGGSSMEHVVGMVHDREGNIYILGDTDSLNFPVANAQQSSLAGGTDLFVTKLDPSGCRILYSTYLGGSGDETAGGLALDDFGRLWVVGTTASTDFPVGSPAIDPTCGTRVPCSVNAPDAFLVGLNPGGWRLVGTFLGGTGADRGKAIAFASDSRLYLGGTTTSTDLPLVSPTQGKLGGGGDAMVFGITLSPTDSAFEAPRLSISFSTYYGGSGTEEVRGVAAGGAETAGSVTVVGKTSSPNLALVKPLSRAGLRGSEDAMVAVWHAFEPKLLLSSYWGGGAADEAQSVAYAGDAVVISGQTWSTDFPLVSARQTSRRGPSDAFLLRINTSAPAVLFSTLHGGSGAESGLALAVSPLGELLLGGGTSSWTDLPLTANAEQASFGGGSSDMYLARFSADGQSLLYGTYLGSTNTEFVSSLASCPDEGWLLVGNLEVQAGPESIPDWDALYALLSPPVRFGRK